MNPARPLILLPAAIVGMSAAPALGDVFTWETSPSGNAWNAPINWAGTLNAFPDGFDDIAIVNYPTTPSNGPTLKRNENVGRVELVNNGSMFTGDGTNNFQLFVHNELFISGAGSDIRVYNSPEIYDLDTDFLTITGANASDRGGIFMNGGAVRVDNNASIGLSGDIRGFGRFVLTAENASQGDIVNDGRFIAEFGTLTIDGAQGNVGLFDWDGFNGNTAQLVVGNNATLDINLSQGNDAFDGEITIAQNGTFDNAFDWTLAQGGEMRFNGPTIQPGIVRGGDVVSRGTINAQLGSASFQSRLDVLDGSVLIGIADFGASNFTRLTVKDGFVNTASDLEFDFGVFEVAAGGDFTIDQAGKLFDWDGTFNNFGTTVRQGAELLVVASTINPNTGAFTANRFAGVLNINSGTLAVQGVGPDLLIAKNGTNTPATVNLLDNGGFSGPVYDGVPIVFGGDSTLNASSTLTNGFGRFDAPVRFDGGEVNVNSGMELIFTDPVEFRGADFAGNGALDFRDDVLVTPSASTLALDIATQFGASSVTTIPSNKILSLNGPVQFQGGTINASSSGRVRLNGGTTIVSGGVTAVTAGIFDLDGSPGIGVVTINSGATLDLTVSRIQENGPERVTGTLNIAGTLAVNNDADKNLWRNAGTINLTGNGRIEGDALVNEGTITSAGTTRIRSPLTFTAAAGSSIDITTGRLTIGADSTFEGGSAVTGGTLFNSNGKTMTLVDGATVDTGIRNFGRVRLGADDVDATTQFDARAFSQVGSGTLEIDIGPDGNDALILTGGIDIAGTLELRPATSGFVPLPVDEYTVVAHLGARTGTFDDVTDLVGLAALGFDVEYLADRVVVRPVRLLGGDANFDGVVNLGDFTILANDFGISGGRSGADFTLDGAVNLADFTVLANAFGTALSPDAAFAPGAGDLARMAAWRATVPEPAAAGVVGLAAVLAGRRRAGGRPRASLGR